MITVEKIWEGVRREGLNFGLPTTFIQLGPGPEYSSESLVKDILLNTRCKWVCIFGENTTQVGMGTLVKGLSSVGMYIEVEASGSVRDPGWLHTVDRWVIDYAKEGSFNYNALRSQDMIRFLVKGEGDLNFVRESFPDLSMFPGTKYIKLDGDKTKVTAMFKGEAFALVRRNDRCRLYTS